MDEIVILSPLGMLGYGVPEQSVERAREEFDIDVIAIDAGSMDPGPNYLGQGKFFADEQMVERDLRILLIAADEENVPFLLGTAGGAGARPHHDKVMDIVREIASEENLEFSAGKIYSDVDREYVKRKVRGGAITDLGLDTNLSEDDIDQANRIVAQVGVTPFINALEQGSDVVVGGRASDLSPFAAIPIREGFDPGLVYHLSKILECGARATTAASGNDCLMGIIRDNHFEVIPPNPNRRCSEESVAAHTLYEKSDPRTISLPEGTVDVSSATFEQINNRRVRVSGSTFSENESHTVLVEGVELRGYRTITPAGIRDPGLIDRIDELIELVEDRVHEIADVDEDRYHMLIRVYGHDAVPLLGERTTSCTEEAGVIIDVVGETQVIADTVCGLARSSLLHFPLEGRINSGGNLAFPYSPSDISTGAVYNLSIYHLLKDVNPDDIAEIEIEHISPVEREVA